MSLYYNYGIPGTNTMTLWQDRPFTWADGSIGVTKQRIATVNISTGRCDCASAQCPHVRLVREIKAKGE